ncbi:glycosyl hydrolase family 28-related protein [Streptomyces brevispora]|uniref:Right-handed parallel beta-helix repeat-containing protein n=1 Tax=Streptomyces brevispora TaxID=887462 RepID=A0ABZ1G3J0_9ACTN|nr:right-handed parallel beta-helix repeat-containing protein [Streptomyces brevispora]WSC14370.1 right-handed parallel beta-helix repeat-containing protein [Streptomyces brevispora]
MALYTYGGNGSAVLTDTAGNVIPDYPVIVRVAGTGQPVTALYEADGTTPISELRSNTAGQDSPGAIRPFKVADVLGIQYEYNGLSGPVRWFEQGREVGAAALSGLGAKLDKSGGTITGDLNIEGTLTVDGQPGGATFPRAHIYNVADRGAIGNGVTDDAPAIQAALNAARDAGGGTVLIPAGTYRLASLPLRIYRNTHLRCLPGARLIRALDTTMLINGDAGQNYGIYTGHGNITVEGGTWDMRGTVVTASSMCMSFGHAEGITVRGITVLDLPGYHGVEFNAVKNGRVLNSVFRGYINPGSRDFSEAIQIDLAKSHDEFGGFGPYDDTPCVDILIDDCTVGPSGTPGTTSWPRGIGSHSASPNKQHRDIRIIGCRFEGCLQYAIGAYVWSGVVIDDVQLRDCAGGIRIRPLTSATASQRTPAGGTTPTITGSQPVTGYAISNMTMIGGGTFDAGIRGDGEETGYIGALAISNVVCKDIAGSAVRLLYCEDYSVQQVVAINAGSTAISQFGVRRGRVQGCTVNGTGGAGIGLDSRATPSATATDVTIADCMVTGAAANGISVWDGADVTITDCDLHDLTGAGVQISANTARPVLRDNRTRNCSTANISVSSTITGAVRWNNTGDAPTAQSVATAANTTAETVLASWSIPAGDAADRCAYRFTAQGVASTTGTPTLTIRVRLGGVAGTVVAAFTAVTTAAGIAGRGWRVDGSLLPIAPGASGTWAGGATLTHHLASTTGAVQHELTDAPVTRDSTSSQALVVTAQWSAASASNTASASVGQLTRTA